MEDLDRCVVSHDATLKTCLTSYFKGFLKVLPFDSSFFTLSPEREKES